MKKLFETLLLSMLSLTMVYGSLLSLAEFIDFKGKTEIVRASQSYTDRLIQLSSDNTIKLSDLTTQTVRTDNLLMQHTYPNYSQPQTCADIFNCVLTSVSSTVNSVGARERNPKKCKMEKMITEYLNDGDVDAACWYCKVVVVLTNSYLKAASDVLGVSMRLGQLCAKLGFMIWLAYYILLQVSSFAPITPFKMMQEILVMGFKVALAYKGASLGMQFVVFYFINPIMGLGVDYGSALLDSLLASHNIDVALANATTPD